jgi:hypothetical protein
MTALFVLLFAGAYAWLAMQPTINRPFVAFGAIARRRRSSWSSCCG